MRERSAVTVRVTIALPCAGGAESVQSQRVCIDPEFRGRQFAKIIEAAGNIKNAVAFLALEMVMMPFVRALVSRWFARYFDRFDPAVVEKSADCPVDGCYAQAVDTLRAGLEQFADAQRPIGARQYFLQGLPLLGFSTVMSGHGYLSRFPHSLLPPARNTLTM